MNMPKTLRKRRKSPSIEPEKAQTKKVGEGRKESSLTGKNSERCQDDFSVSGSCNPRYRWSRATVEKVWLVHLWGTTGDVWE